MPAGIVESAHAPLAITHDNDRVLADLDGQVLARIEQFTVMTDEQPIAIPNHIEVDLEILGTDVEVPFQGGGGLAVAQAFQHDVAGIGL
jgi:hypothetical protein